MKRLIIILLAVVSAAAYADVEIIVTASRIEEDSKTTPAWVRVIPEEEIDKKATVLDVLKTIPDISVKETSPGKSYISMGGFGDIGFARTLIMINGRSVNRPDMASFDWNSITLSSVSRIEIIKGSMSSQYGDQAVAGVINIITKQPVGLTATVSGSITNTLTNKESVFTSYGNETAGIALGINRTDNNPARDRSDSTNLSANIDTFFNYLGIEIKLGSNFLKSEYELPGGLTIDEYKADPDQAGDPDNQGESISYSINGTTSFSLGNLKLSVPLSYSIVDTSADLYGYSDSLLNTITAGPQINGDYFFGDSLAITTIGGIDAKRSAITVKEYSDSSRTIKTSQSEVLRIDSGVWGRTKVNYVDTFIIDGGLRYGYSNLDTNPSIIHAPLVYDIGMVWLPSSEIRFSLRYGSVFRYPLLEEQYENGYTDLNINLVPETGNNYTASIDYAMNDIRVTVSPYLISMEDEIAYVGSWPTGKNENIGSTLHYGISVESGFSKGILSINTGYAYDHAEFTDTKKIIPRVPEHTVYGAFEVALIKSFTVSTDGRYSSEFYTDEANTDSVPGRFEWNMRADWNINEEITIYLAAKNILDDRTPTLAYSTFSWYPMPGRTFETGLKWVY